MANPGEELATLDFEAMIGGPLVAVIKAQSQAAMTSVNYIKAVGFTTNTTTNEIEPIMVSFTYSRDVPDPNDATKTIAKKFQLQVPILTMLPIPFIRIEETTIDFNAKIVATTFTRTDTDLKVGVDLEAKGGWGPFSASLKASFSYQKKTSSGEDVQRTYSMVIHVRAVQDEMPAGTEKLLQILENVIKEAEAPAATPTPPGH